MPYLFPTQAACEAEGGDKDRGARVLPCNGGHWTHSVQPDCRRRASLRYGSAPSPRKLTTSGSPILLNSAALSGYPFSTSSVISMTNSALSSGDRSTMLSLASDFDTANNLGCPFN